MNFVGLVKDFCLMVLLVVVTNACAMELVPYRFSADEFVQKFPSMTFAAAHYNWKNSLSDDVKKEIEAAEEKRNKGKASLIFDMVRFLHPDLCGEIIQRFCDYDDEKIKCFLNLSIENFAQMAAKTWAQEVYDCKKCQNFNTCIRMRGGYSMKSNAKKPFDLEKILKYAGSIVLVDRYYKEDGLSLETIRLLDIVFSEIDKSDEFDKPIELRKKFAYKKRDYHYTLPYTLPNFSAAFNERFYYTDGESRPDMLWIKALSAPMVTCLLSQFIRESWCQKVLRPDIVERNYRREKLNELINGSEHAELLARYMMPMTDPIEYSEMDRHKIFLLPALLIFPFAFQQRYIGMGSILHIFVSGISSAACACLHIIGNEILGDRVLFIGSVVCVSLMVGYAAISSLVQMRKVRSEKIPWDALDELFKKHHDKHIFVE